MEKKIQALVDDLRDKMIDEITRIANQHCGLIIFGEPEPVIEYPFEDPYGEQWKFYLHKVRVIGETACAVYSYDGEDVSEPEELSILSMDELYAILNAIS